MQKAISSYNSSVGEPSKEYIQNVNNPKAQDNLKIHIPRKTTNEALPTTKAAIGRLILAAFKVGESDREAANEQLFALTIHIAKTFPQETNPILAPFKITELKLDDFDTLGKVPVDNLLAIALNAVETDDELLQSPFVKRMTQASTAKPSAFDFSQSAHKAPTSISSPPTSPPSTPPQQSPFLQSTRSRLRSRSPSPSPSPSPLRSPSRSRSPTRSRSPQHSPSPVISTTTTTTAKPPKTSNKSKKKGTKRKQLDTGSTIPVDSTEYDLTELVEMRSDLEGLSEAAQAQCRLMDKYFLGYFQRSPKGLKPAPSTFPFHLREVNRDHIQKLRESFEDYPHTVGICPDIAVMLQNHTKVKAEDFTHKMFMDLPNWVIGGCHEVVVLQELLESFPNVLLFQQRRFILFNRMPDLDAAKIARLHNNIPTIHRPDTNSVDTIGYRLLLGKYYQPNLARLRKQLHKNKKKKSEFVVTDGLPDSEDDDITVGIQNEPIELFEIENPRKYKTGKPVGLNQLFAFNKLDIAEDVRRKLLLRIVNGQITFKQGLEQCNRYYTQHIIRMSLLSVVESHNWSQTAAAYPTLCSDEAINQWMGVFQDLRKGQEIPVQFVKWVKQTVKGKERNRENSSSSTKQEFVFLDSVTATVICGNALQLTNILTVPADKNDHTNDLHLVFVDLPKGESTQAWDVPWQKEQYTQLITSIQLCNSLSDWPLVSLVTPVELVDLQHSLRNGWTHHFGVWTWDARVMPKQPTLIDNGMCMLTSLYGDPEAISVYNVNGNAQLSCLHFAKPLKYTTMKTSSVKVINPTERPVELLKHLIYRYTLPGQIVLDIGSGSGSFAEAAICAGRNVISIERDEEQFKGICQRLRILQRSLKSFVADQVLSDDEENIDDTAKDTPNSDTTSGSNVPPAQDPLCVICGKNKDEQDTPLVSCHVCTTLVHEGCGLKEDNGKFKCTKDCIPTPDGSVEEPLTQRM